MVEVEATVECGIEIYITVGTTINDCIWYQYSWGNKKFKA
jgi:hypothetical protein